MSNDKKAEIAKCLFFHCLGIATGLILALWLQPVNKYAPLRNNFVAIKGNHFSCGGWYDYSKRFIIDGDTIDVYTENYKSQPVKSN